MVRKREREKEMNLEFRWLLSQGVGRRYANLVCKKADVDMRKRAGELSDEEVGVYSN